MRPYKASLLNSLVLIVVGLYGFYSLTVPSGTALIAPIIGVLLLGMNDGIKNQNKTTVKINTRKTKQVAYKVLEPEHKSIRREMGRGRLLFHVSFEKGTAYLDIDSIKELFKIKDF